MLVASSLRTARAFSTSALRAAAPVVKKAKAGASILPAGTKMDGLGVFKDKGVPVALKDEEYPAWLWKLLDEPAAPAEEGEWDFKTERKRLRAQNRTNIKASNYLKTT